MCEETPEPVDRPPRFLSRNERSQANDERSRFETSSVLNRDTGASSALHARVTQTRPSSQLPSRLTGSRDERYPTRVSLRSKLIALFCALAVAPLLALGVFQYVRSTNAVRDLLRAQTSAVAMRVNAQTSNRVSTVRGELALLANNGDVVRLLATHGDPREAEQFVVAAMRNLGAPFDTVVYRDTTGAAVLVVPGTDTLAHRGTAPGSPTTDDAGPGTPRRQFVLPVSDGRRRLGTMTTSTAMDVLVPPTLLDAKVGLTGYTLIIDRLSRRALAGDTRTGGGDRGFAALDSLAAHGDTSAAVVSYVENDTARIASVVPVSGDDLAVVAAASVPEYAGPLATSRATNLSLALAVAAAIGLAFLLLARRLTRPLETLIIAAEEIGRGNFDPALPSATSDEVGQLAGAFRAMTTKIAETLRQMEASRQMAAVGAFAAQIAHEIRNPLTSIKLNLQSVQRDLVGSGRPEVERPIDICLREIQRLDGVVRGVLRLGEPARGDSQRISAHEVVREAADLTRAQLDSAGVRLTVALVAECDSVHAHAAVLRGALLNLILNAAEMLPSGGRVHVRTEVVDDEVPTLRIAVADTGPGVPSELRERIFEPFYSTKPGGSGLGLALAARDVENHRGRLALLEQPGELGGATFAIDLPVASDASI
jgi:signal transduction histidine kinase